MRMISRRRAMWIAFFDGLLLGPWFRTPAENLRWHLDLMKRTDLEG
jgi:hypothetical protein